MAQSYINNGESGSSVRAKLNDRWQVLAQSSVGVSGAADTNENTLATIAVPANAMGANGRLRITTQWTLTSSANNKTVKVKFGATTYTNVVVTTNASARFQTEIGNRNAANSQVGGMVNGSLGTSGSAVVTSAIDTSAEVNITITAQKASSGETMTLESYIVELLNAA